MGETLYAKSWADRVLNSAVRERKLNAHSINHGKVPVRRPQKDILAL